MIIRVKGNLVDFDAPIYATDEQREKLLAFFTENYPDTIIQDVSEPERQYDERTAKEFHKWTAKDYLELFTNKSNEEIASGLGSNTSMGVQVKRGTFVMNFLKWRKAHTQSEPITEQLIQQFLDEVNL